MKPDTQNQKMMMNTTLNQLRSLRLETMAQAQQQLQQSGISAMSFEERLALLVDREVRGRQDRRCARWPSMLAGVVTVRCTCGCPTWVTRRLPMPCWIG